MSTIIMICLAALVVAALIPVACGIIPGAEPSPTPTPYGVGRVYGYLEDLKENNVARLREMEHKWRVRFRGTIDRVEERRIRFSVEPPRVLADDKYVECNFRSSADMISLYKGADVTVQARLVRALRGRLLGIGEHGAVFFEDCELVEVHVSSSRDLRKGILEATFSDVAQVETPSSIPETLQDVYKNSADYSPRNLRSAAISMSHFRYHPIDLLVKHGGIWPWAVAGCSVKDSVNDVLDGHEWVVRWDTLLWVDEG